MAIGVTHVLTCYAYTLAYRRGEAFWIRSRSHWIGFPLSFASLLQASIWTAASRPLKCRSLMIRAPKIAVSEIAVHHKFTGPISYTMLIIDICYRGIILWLTSCYRSIGNAIGQSSSMTGSVGRFWNQCQCRLPEHYICLRRSLYTGALSFAAA